MAISNSRAGIDPFALLRESSVFGPLPKEALRGLAATAVVETFRVPTLLYAEGTEMRWLRLVVRGRIDMVVRRPNGDEVVLAELGPGNWISWLGCLTVQRQQADLYSGGDACCLALPATQLRDFCAQFPDVYLRILEEVGARMQHLIDWTTHSVLLKPEQRLARLILVLARSQGIAGPSGLIQITQARLARLAGCSRQSVGGLLEVLKKRGLVAGNYGELKLPDLDALKEFTTA